MKNILVIGGTRNLGYLLALRLLENGHRVTVLNRGMTRDTLPDAIHRLRADRTSPQQMRRALMGKHFDIIIDFVMYQGSEAENIVNLLDGAVEHYLFISTGQVYLVREDIQRPFHEDQYEGLLLPAPKENTYAYEEWRYGMSKRECEDIFKAAYRERQFPYTSLRLPMVNSERDHFHRLYNYILRIKDGGPILVPETPRFPLRHVYGDDVIRAVEYLINTGKGKGEAYNISQDETVSIDEFLAIVGQHLGIEPKILRVKRSSLEANGFLPDCSPFSERWMSELDNTRSKTELNIVYTPLDEYLGRLVDHYKQTKIPTPLGYKRRPAELQVSEHITE